MSEKGPRMILCAGLQSGGTTLISWCFLQRRDADGVLDMPNDVIQTSFEKAKEPVLWVKQTVGSFRWLDVREPYRDLGWEPEPLLVVRDARATYASLRNKFYGINGTTAEDPPFRMRFRRFLRDWELFRENGWPIMKFEDFVREPRAVLKRACAELSLPWDEGMISWPKKPSEISYVRTGKLNETFEKSFGRGGLTAAKLDDRAGLRIESLPVSELEWLEEAFSEYNGFHGYPEEVPLREGMPAAMPAPGYEHTARAWYYGENERLSVEYWKLVEENEELRVRIGEFFDAKRGREP